MIYKKHIYSLVSLFTGTFLSMFIGFVTKIFLARHTSLEVFGNYSTVIVLISTFLPLCGFGIAQWWLKISGQFGDRSIIIIKKSLVFVIYSTLIVSFVLFAIFIYIYNGDILLMSIFLLSILYVGVVSELVSSVFQLQNKYISLSIWQCLQTSSILLIAFVSHYIFRQGFSEIAFGIFYLISAIVFFIIGLSIIKKYVAQNEKLYPNTNVGTYNDLKYSTGDIIKESIPFGISSLFYLIYYQLGIVFVRFLDGAESASYYNIAFSFLTISIVVPSVLYQKFLLPKLHRWAYHDQKKIHMSYIYGNYLMLFLGLMCGIVFWLLAPYLINWFFGQKYEPATSIIQLMVLNIPIVYLASNAGSLLVTKNHMKIKIFYMGVAALISIFLMPIMILEYGVYGAVIVNIISNFFICVVYNLIVYLKVLNYE